MSNIAETKFICSNYVTRKLITGPKRSFINKLERDFGVKIGAKISTTPVVEVKGAKANEENVKKVVELLQLLDQKASVLANQYNLTNTGDVNTDHWNHIHVDLYAMLGQKEKPAQKRGLNLSKDGTTPKSPLTPVAKKDFSAAASAGDAKTKAPKKQAIQFLSDFEPKNVRQAITYEACMDTKTLGDGSRELVNSYVFAAGPFGGGKTYTPIRAGFELYSQGLVHEIIFIRPSTTTSKHNPGAMPGSPRAKIDPYIKGGIGSNVAKIIKTPLAELEKAKVVRVLTPEFERGESYDHAFILVDEPQNLTIEQAELLIGRLGEGSIMVFAGDIGGSQNDIRGQMPGLAHLIATQGSATKTDKILAAKTAFIRFTDEDSAARNGILPHVSHALRNPPQDYAAFLKVIQESRQDARLVKAIDDARKFGEQTLTEIAEATFNRYEKRIRAKYPSLSQQGSGTVHVLRPAQPNVG